MEVQEEVKMDKCYCVDENDNDNEDIERFKKRFLKDFEDEVRPKTKVATIKIIKKSNRKKKNK